jgi:hypothetical protein
MRVRSRCLPHRLSMGGYLLGGSESFRLCQSSRRHQCHFLQHRCVLHRLHLPRHPAPDSLVVSAAAATTAGRRFRFDSHPCRVGGALGIGLRLRAGVGGFGGEQQSVTTPQAARGWNQPPYRHIKIEYCCCLASAFERGAFQTLCRHSDSRPTAVLGSHARVRR